jgi:hypothetical protein
MIQIDHEGWRGRPGRVDADRHVRELWHREPGGFAFLPRVRTRAQHALVGGQRNGSQVLTGWTNLMCRHARAALVAVLASALLPAITAAQDTAPDSCCHADAGAPQDPPVPAEAQSTEEHPRIFGLIPNYRTSPTLKDYHPLTPGAKFKVAADDSFDRGTFVLAALFAADAQWTAATPSFGRGVHAYARYYPAALSDLVLGDVMTEAVYPVVLRQDPRYFRRGTGSGWARLGYAIGQIVWTHTDAGGTQFNFSEVLGNATAVAIGNTYYPDNRTVSSNVTKLSLQIAVDMASNILKEFSPDLDRRFSRPRAPKPPHP